MAVDYRCEGLEPRRLLCALHIDFDPVDFFHAPTGAPTPPDVSPAGVPDIINWSNRGNANDNFVSVFGANAPAARAVVDAAIDAWERVIVSFNYDPLVIGGRLDLNVKMAASGTTTGASASLNNAFAGKITQATITLGRGGDTNGDGIGDGAGWFIDPTPNESSEFQGNIVNAYAGDAPVGSPAFGLSDLFTVTNAELTHSVGLFYNSILPGLLAWGSTGTNQNTGVPDTSEGGGTNGNYIAFNGSQIKHLMTMFDSGAGNTGGTAHTAGSIDSAGMQPLPFAGQNYVGAEDSGNAFFEGGRRYLVPNTVRLMLDEVYGYPTVNPDQFGTFYTSFNSTTGQVLLRGGAGASNDFFTVSRSGTIITVSANIGNDVPGTGSLAGNGNLPAFVSNYDTSEVSSILIQGGDGNDTINISSIDSSTTVSIQGGEGTDSLVLASADQNLDNIAGAITFDGGGGSDSIFMYDANANFNDTYTLTAGGVDRTVFSSLSYSNAESLYLGAESGNNIININGNNIPTTIAGNSGNDTFNIGNGNYAGNITANLQITGDGGTDAININDNAVFGSSFTISPTGVQTSGADVSITTMETRTLNAGTGTNAVTFDALGGFFGSSWTINGNDGADTFHYISPGGIDDFTVPMTLNGGAGDDTLYINDGPATTPHFYTFTSTRIDNSIFAAAYHNAIENLSLSGGSAADTFVADSLPAGITARWYGGAGADIYNLGSAANTVETLDATVNIEDYSGGGTLNYLDSSNTFADTYTLTVYTLTRTASGVVGYLGLSTLNITLGSAANIINIDSSSPDSIYNINGSGGTDTVNFAAPGDNLSTVEGTINLQNTIEIANLYDTLAAGAPAYTFNFTSFSRTGSGTINFSNALALSAYAGNGASTFTINGVSSLGSLTLDSGGGQDTVNVQNSSVVSQVYLLPNAGFDFVRVNTDLISSATAQINGTQSLGQIQAANGGSVTLDGNATHVVTTQSLFLTGSGNLNLRGQSMIIDYPTSSVMNTIRGYIFSGYAGGAWNGAGVNDSIAASTFGRAVGFAEATDLYSSFPATFQGQTIDNTSILIEHTIIADANLDFKVTTLDFNLLAGHFGQTSARWSWGDFNYDGTVNSIDFSILVANYGRQLPLFAPTLSSTPTLFGNTPIGTSKSRDEDAIV